MPFIEESDLLELHKDIDKAQIINERLLDQIKYKNKELRKNKIQRNVFAGITALFLIGGLAFTSFTAGLSSSGGFNRKSNNDLVLTSIDSVDAIRTRLENLKEQNEDIRILGIDAYGSVLKKYHETRDFDEDEIYPYRIEGLGKN